MNPSSSLRQDNHQDLKQQLPWIGLILALAFSARLIFLIIFGGLDDTLHDSFEDQSLYLDLAHNVAAGQGFSVSSAHWVADAGKPNSLMPPLYPVFLALDFQWFGPSLIPIRLIHIVLSLVIVLVV